MAPDLHEKNSVRIEKRCFAGKSSPVLLIRLLAAARNEPKALWSRSMSKHVMQGWALSPREIAREEAINQQSDLSSRAGGWLHGPLFWIERSRQRRRLGELAELNNHLLRDIGVTREEALREALRPFWRGIRPMKR
jgi:hypothetical protein